MAPSCIRALYKHTRSRVSSALTATLGGENAAGLLLIQLRAERHDCGRLTAQAIHREIAARRPRLHKHRHADTQTHRHTDTQTPTQTHRHTDTQTHHTHAHTQLQTRAVVGEERRRAYMNVSAVSIGRLAGATPESLL
jgi:hypothetical protein